MDSPDAPRARRGDCAALGDAAARGSGRPAPITAVVARPLRHGDRRARANRKRPDPGAFAAPLERAARDFSLDSRSRGGATSPPSSRRRRRPTASSSACSCARRGAAERSRCPDAAGRARAGSLAAGARVVAVAFGALHAAATCRRVPTMLAAYGGQTGAQVAVARAPLRRSGDHRKASGHDPGNRRARDGHLAKAAIR